MVAEAVRLSLREPKHYKPKNTNYMKLSIEVNSQVIQIDIPESIGETKLSLQIPQISCKDYRYSVDISFLPLVRKQCETFQCHSSHQPHQHENGTAKLARWWRHDDKSDEEMLKNSCSLSPELMNKAVRECL